MSAWRQSLFLSKAEDAGQNKHAPAQQRKVLHHNRQ